MQGEEPLKLERILGISTLNNASFTSSKSGDLFYIAGCCVVRYNPELNKQVGFYNAGKPIASIAISFDGCFLAVGEKGSIPLISVWNIDSYAISATLTGHKYGVGCVSFSPNGKYLVSVGFKHNKQLIVWNWKSSRQLSVQKLSNKVNSITFHPSGDFFVTAGDRHLKWWMVSEVVSGSLINIKGKPAGILEHQKNSIFMDVVCGTGDFSSFVYCTTASGVLCVFNESRTVEKWVQLESPASFCLEIFCDPGSPGLLVVGCATGIVRCFSPKDLEYIATLPLPAPLSGSPASSIGQHAACCSLRKVYGTVSSPIPKLASIYTDKSLYVWDISNIYEIAKYRSFLFHCACIWDLQFIDHTTDPITFTSGTVDVNLKKTNKGEPKKIPKGTFLTCGADDTIRMWNIDSRAQRESKFRNVYSKEMLHCVELKDETSEDPDSSFFSEQNSVLTSVNTLNRSHLNYTTAVGGGQEWDLSMGILDTEVPCRPQSRFMPRCLAVHPWGHEIACGDKTGRIRVYDLSTMLPKEVAISRAHSAEVLTLSYSPSLSSMDGGANWEVDVEEGKKALERSKQGKIGEEYDLPMVLLASGGRDRLIHVFNSTMNYQLVDTLDLHESSVTIVHFTSNGNRLLSCGGDKTLMFSKVNGPEIVKFKSVQTQHGTINGLAVDASNKFAITSGQDKRMNIWNINTGKHIRSYKSNGVNAELYKSDIDPSGIYIATCAFDKTVSMFDFFSGELVAQVSAHSELVTGVKFSPDGRFLLTIGGDGCIMFWRISQNIVKNMQDRLMELYAIEQRKSQKILRKSLTQVEISKLKVENDTTEKVEKKVTEVVESLDSPLNIAKKPRTDDQNPASKPDTSINKDKQLPKSRWAIKAEKEGEYDLFGRKILPGAQNPNLNKFTLELNATNAPTIKPKPIEESHGTHSPLASTLEAEDNVMLSGLSDLELDDENDDDDALFHPKKDDSEEDPEHEELGVGKGGEGDEDGSLLLASSKIDVLEKSAIDLENWLEDMIRQEGNLDNNAVLASSDSIKEKNNEKSKNKEQAKEVKKSDEKSKSRSPNRTVNPLNQSLSSEFFRKLKSEDDNPAEPIENNSKNIKSNIDVNLVLQQKQKKTAAALALMKDKLHDMGIPTKNEPPAPPTKTEAARPILPPPPPTDNELRQSGYDSADTVSEDELGEGLKVETGLKGPTSVGEETPMGKSQYRAKELAKKLKTKSNEYKNILSELEAAKQKAAKSYKELKNLRSSLNESMKESSSFENKKQNFFNDENDLESSIIETDQLLKKFQESLTNLPVHILNEKNKNEEENGINSLISSSLIDLKSTFSTKEPLDITANAFLEKYSDKLVTLVSEKLTTQIKKSLDT